MTFFSLRSLFLGATLYVATVISAAAQASASGEAGSPDQASTVAVSPDCHWLATGGKSGLNLWRKTGIGEQTKAGWTWDRAIPIGRHWLDPQFNIQGSIAFSPDSTRVMAFLRSYPDNDGQSGILIWDLAANREVTSRFDDPCGSPATVVALSPSGSRIAWASHCEIAFASAATGEKIAPLDSEEIKRAGWSDRDIAVGFKDDDHLLVANGGSLWRLTIRPGPPIRPEQVVPPLASAYAKVARLGTTNRPCDDAVAGSGTDQGLGYGRFSANCGTVYYREAQGFKFILIHDIASGKDRRIDKPEAWGPGYIEGYAVTPNEQQVIMVTHNGPTVVLNFHDGALLQILQIGWTSVPAPKSQGGGAAPIDDRQCRDHDETVNVTDEQTCPVYQIPGCFTFFYVETRNIRQPMSLKGYFCLNDADLREADRRLRSGNGGVAAAAAYLAHTPGSTGRVSYTRNGCPGCGE